VREDTDPASRLATVERGGGSTEGRGAWSGDGIKKRREKRGSQEWRRRREINGTSLNKTKKNGGEDRCSPRVKKKEKKEGGERKQTFENIPIGVL